MNRPLWFCVFVLSLALFVPGGLTQVLAQELARQPTAFTAWLDFGKRQTELPIWIERVETQSVKGDAAQGQAPKTVYRVRFRRFAGLVDEVLLRVYFQDAPGEQPEEDLRAAEVKFARFFNSTPMAIATLDESGRVLRSNAAFAQLLPRALAGGQAGAPAWPVLIDLNERSTAAAT